MTVDDARSRFWAAFRPQEHPPDRMLLAFELQGISACYEGSRLISFLDPGSDVVEALFVFQSPLNGEAVRPLSVRQNRRFQSGPPAKASVQVPRRQLVTPKMGQPASTDVDNAPFRCHT